MRPDFRPIERMRPPVEVTGPVHIQLEFADGRPAVLPWSPGGREIEGRLEGFDEPEDDDDRSA